MWKFRLVKYQLRHGLSVALLLSILGQLSSAPLGIKVAPPPACPYGCDCDTNSRTVVCLSSDGYTQPFIPERSINNTASFHISEAVFLNPTLLSANLTSYPNITLLDITLSNLKTITSRAFTKTPSLQSIGFVSNNLQVVEDFAFAGLNLTILDLSDNKGVKLMQKVFHDMVALESLTLTSTGLSGLEFDILRPILPRLVSLGLEQNSLKTLDPRIVETAPRLRSLMLTGNSWVCDCQLVWLVKRAQERRIALSGAPDCSAFREPKDSPCYKKISANVSTMADQGRQGDQTTTDTAMTINVGDPADYYDSQLSLAELEKRQRLMRDYPNECYTPGQLVTAVIVAVFSAAFVFVVSCLIVRCCRRCCRGDSYSSSGRLVTQTPSPVSRVTPPQKPSPVFTHHSANTTPSHTQTQRGGSPPHPQYSMQNGNGGGYVYNAAAAEALAQRLVPARKQSNVGIYTEISQCDI